jgi:threonine aldolase
LLPGRDYRLEVNELVQAITSAGVGQRHRVQPAAVSVTQATEHGTVYKLEELKAIEAAARKASLRLHMDGARFTNALVTLGCTPAQMTWRVGVDVLALGATKNGGLSAEAIVVFNPGLTEDLAFRLRRAGQTWSKMRFAAAQLIAYVEDGLFLRSAKRANSLALRLANGLRHMPHMTLLAPVEANELFIRTSEDIIERLAQEGFLFHRRATNIIRLVCRMDGSEQEIDSFLSAAGRACGALGPST